MFAKRKTNTPTNPNDIPQLRATFSAKTTVFTQNQCVPGGGLLRTAYITMHDSCTWQKCNIDENGRFDVDCVFRVRDKNEDRHLEQLSEFCLNDRIKIHFFTQNENGEVFAAAGHWPLEDVLIASHQATALAKAGSMNKSFKTLKRCVLAGDAPGTIVEQVSESVSTSYQCKHNFHPHGIQFDIIPSRTASVRELEDNHKTFTDAKKKGFVDQCPLSDSDKYNGLILTQANYTRDMINKTFVCDESTGSPMFQLPLTMYSMDGQMTRYVDLYRNMMFQMHQHAPFAVAQYDMIMGLKFNKCKGLDTLNRRDRVHCFSDTETAHTWDGQLSTYIGDETFGGFAIYNNQIMPQHVPTERLSRSGSYPLVPIFGACAFHDDCDGFTNDQIRLYKSIAILGMHVEGMTHDEVLEFASGPDFDVKMLSKVSLESRVQLLLDAAYYWSLMKENKLLVTNVLGVALGASADQQTRELGGHSYSDCFALDEDETAFSILMEGTAAVRQLNTKAQDMLTACVRLPAEPHEVPVLKNLGFEIDESDQNNPMMVQHMDPSMLVQIAEGSDFLSTPETSTSCRRMIPFMPHGKCMRQGIAQKAVARLKAQKQGKEVGANDGDEDNGFYQHFFIKGDQLVAESPTESMMSTAMSTLGLKNAEKHSFGTKYTGYADRMDKLSFVKLSGRPLDDKEADCVEKFTQRRNNVMFCPLVDHKDILASCDEFYHPIEFPDPDHPFDNLSNHEIMNDYVHISSSTPWKTLEEKKKMFATAQADAERFNADASIKGLGHRASAWCAKTVVIRTLSLCIKDVKDVTLSNPAANPEAKGTQSTNAVKPTPIASAASKAASKTKSKACKEKVGCKGTGYDSSQWWGGIKKCS